MLASVPSWVSLNSQSERGLSKCRNLYTGEEVYVVSSSGRDHELRDLLTGLLAWTRDQQSERWLWTTRFFQSASADEDFPYGIGAHYNGEKIAEEYLTVEKIPAHTYAVFKCTGTMPEAFQRVYKYICTEFFPACEYQPCGVEIEAYPSADVQNPDYICEIWIAVEKKK